MTAMREVYLVCDVCESGSDTLSYGLSTVAEVREHCKNMEWRYRSGRDICAECWEAGER